MNLGFQVREAWLNFSAAKLRCFLALLGILIGTASVVAMLSGGKIATAQVLRQFKLLGTDLMAVYMAHLPDKRVEQPVTIDTILNLSHLDSVTDVAPYTMRYKMITLPGGKATVGGVFGATYPFATINHITMAQGRFIHLFDQNSPYAVIGAALYKILSFAV